MDDRRKPSVSMRENGTLFDAFEPLTPSLIYADGVHQIGIGPIVSKLVFYTTPGNKMEDGVAIEQREITVTLAIPTVVLLETLSRFVSQAKSFGPAMKEALDKVSETLVNYTKE